MTSFSRPASSPFSLATRAALAGVLVLVGAATACSGGGEGTQGQGGAPGSGAGPQAGSGGDVTTATTGTTNTGAGTGGAPGCATDADCAGDPSKPVCDAATGDCVGCLPDNDACPNGQYCDAATNTCAAGCNDASDCVAPQLCDPAAHQCTDCVKDDDCPLGQVCFEAEQCVYGCTDMHGCDDGASCCGGTCFDLQSDPKNCGACGKVCPAPDNTQATCATGMCSAPCAPGWADCNGTLKDGCEWNVLQDGACLCKPGDTMPCYTGAPGTEGKGPCKGGTQTCNPDGVSWSACVGQVLPKFEVCANKIDDDCDGQVDIAPDFDGDGWSRCEGDCCDIPADGCGTPALVNPGAFDIPGNKVNDDCSGGVDDAVTTCDNGLASNSATATDYAKAIDLCQTTTANAAKPQKKWGVLSASFSLADGAGTPATDAKSIRTKFGSNVGPKKGSAMAVLSSGAAAAKVAPANVSPSYVSFQLGKDQGKSSGYPADWLAANNNKLPNAPGCPAPIGNTANDPIMLQIKVRVPTNAKSFEVSQFFFSAEYPEWVCTEYNDFFLTLLDSAFVPGIGESPNPKDKNLAFYDPPPAGGTVYPLGVNLATGNTGLFSQCKNGAIGCSGSNAGTTNKCVSTAQLTGTGFDDAIGGCSTNNLLGGGTGWLTTGGNVKPGETITLRFVIWDTSDGIYDSLALIDNFTWSLNATTPGTHN